MINSSVLTSSAGTSFQSLDALWRLLRVVDHEKLADVDYDTLKYVSGKWPSPLLDAGVLKRGENLTDVCPEDCAEGGCSKTPEWVQYPGRDGKVPVVFCFNPDCDRRMEIKPEELMTWVVDVRGIAQRVSDAMAAISPPVEMIPDRIYHLGREPHSSRSVAVVRGPIEFEMVVGIDEIFTFGRPVPRDPRLSSSTRVTALHEVIEVVKGKWALRQTAFRLPNGAQGSWLTVTAAAELLVRDFHIDLPTARARVSAAATREAFGTNGQTRDKRRIEPHSFNSWRLKLRDRDLDAEDED